MSRRDDFFRAIRFQEPDSIPFYFVLCPELKEEFYRRTGREDYLEYYDVPVRPVKINPTVCGREYGPYFEGLEKPDYTDEWGVGHVRGNGRESHHFTRMISPMQKFETPEQVWEFPLPDIMAEYRWEGVRERIGELKGKDFVTLSSGVNIDIFEPAWYLRGLDNLLVDFILFPEMAEACLERMTRIKCMAAAKFAELGIDVLVYGDDVGTQRAMMMSADTWRQWLKPRLQRAIQAAREVNPGILCYYHSDGNIQEIIPDLIEIGVDILNPVQPECMDPVEMKKLYGDRIRMWGTIGTQTTMPFGSVAEVEDTVKERIEKVGYNGGLILAPTHRLEPEVPFENIEAFINACRRYSSGAVKERNAVTGGRHGE